MLYGLPYNITISRVNKIHQTILDPWPRLVNPRTTCSRIYKPRAVRDLPYNKQVVGTARLVNPRTTCSRIYKPRAVRDLPYNRSWEQGFSAADTQDEYRDALEVFWMTLVSQTTADIPDEYLDALEVFWVPLVSRTSIETHWKCSGCRWYPGRVSRRTGSFLDDAGIPDEYRDALEVFWTRRCHVVLLCWENCELLQSNFPVWGAMCSNKGICNTSSPDITENEKIEDFLHKTSGSLRGGHKRRH
uniref:Uncharacterized protein n=1 Tax=Timema bartmani TaxID=61472 RepID=A0A7R9EPZ5_9NEOP|nr:unnamed protein product [Timema bartmani]